MCERETFEFSAQTEPKTWDLGVGSKPGWGLKWVLHWRRWWSMVDGWWLNWCLL